MATSNKRKAVHTTDTRNPKQPSLFDYLDRGTCPSVNEASNSAQTNNPFKNNTNTDFDTKQPPKTHPSKKDTDKKPNKTTVTSKSNPKSTETSATKPTSNSTTSKPTSISTTTTTSNSTLHTNVNRTHHQGSVPLFFDLDLNDVVDDDKPLVVNTSHHKQFNNNNNNNTTYNYNSKLYNHNNSTHSTSEKQQCYGKYVKMPYDPKNTYICPHTSEKRPKWELISSVLCEKISSASDFQEALLTYNPTYRGDWSFIGLHQFINAMEPPERELFFSHTLPAIIDLALALPELMEDCQLPVFLPGKQNQHVSLTQHQIASLLANAFLCTFPRRNKAPKIKKHYSAYSSGKSEHEGINNMPTINFNGLFGKSGKVIVNKLHCIVNYFRRAATSVSLVGVVDFERRQITSVPNWDCESATLHSLTVYSEGTIEDSDHNFLHVDFSNKYIGGGVLGRGCVQEEIMFCIYPELIIARLFNTMLDDNECCIFTGAEKYSQYSGYSDSFLFVGDYKDTIPRDSKGRKLTKVVAMDALHFKCTQDQYDQRPILRELNKCYCAFFHPPKTVLQPIATGNWGCGAFNGDLELKALIQLMAAATCKRTLHYFTFENSLFANNLGTIHDFLVTDAITVGELYDALRIFCVERTRRKEEQTIAANSGVFNFLQLYFTNKKM
eukprot:Phypoly_transcript_02603.p1 GENE.Phypoly_transcript_02603~~Phypoly_transcript_02603.p1  ORF type:complete len:689 (+),score=89.35 Phypoly_transcript_02603:72-2069(+)